MLLKFLINYSQFSRFLLKNAHVFYGSLFAVLVGLKEHFTPQQMHNVTPY